MKRNFFASPAYSLATLLTFAPLLQAQEEAEDSKRVQKTATVVVTSTIDSKDIEKKVSEALDKAGFSAELKDKVLTQLAGKLSDLPAIKEVPLRSEKVMKEQAELMKNQAMAMTIQLADLDVENDGEVMTQVMRIVDDQKYRIGVQTSITTSEGEEAEPGVKIEAVFPDTPASEAGIKEGDLILKIDGEDLKSVEQLTKTIQEAGKKEKEIVLEIKRGDDSMKVNVRPSEIKEMDRIVEKIQMLRAPQPGWLFQAEKGPASVGVFGAASGATDLKKELEEIRNEIRDIKEMLKDLKK